jgi:hypothetical protein
MCQFIAILCHSPDAKINMTETDGTDGGRLPFCGPAAYVVAV